ncbi:porin [Zoogloea sp.]|uniref:porin n=1 Tax=Zoogloea sp. TaxID=49181 RepID=UPI0031FDDC5C
MKTAQHLTLASLATLAALASLSAQADDGVVVYGRLNATFENVRVENGHSRNVVNDNASRIGFRGTEDLGGGMAVIYQIESRIRVDGSDSGTTLATRDSWVGLRTQQGTLRLGRSLGPIYYALYDYISMHNHDTGYSSDALLSPAIFGNSNAAGGRMNNQIWYTSPKLGGFTVDATYALLAEEPVSSGSSRTPHNLGLVTSYDAGPLHAAVSYASTQNTTNLDTTSSTVRFNNDRAVTAGGAYNFGPVVVGALFERSKRSTLSEDMTRNYWRVSAMAPVGAHEFHINYGHAGDYSGTSDTGAKQYTLAYNYNLSKRSKVYAYYTKIDNDAARSAGGGGAYSFLGSSAGLDNSSIALGIRHNF